MKSCLGRPVDGGGGEFKRPESLIKVVKIELWLLFKRKLQLKIVGIDYCLVNSISKISLKNIWSFGKKNLHCRKVQKKKF